jgi:hypothetical protein
MKLVDRVLFASVGWLFVWSLATPDFPTPRHMAWGLPGLIGLSGSVFVIWAVEYRQSRANREEARRVDD